jgi:hypothetical protein
MDNQFPERMLLVWLDNSQQGIHDMRQVVCATKLRAFWDDANEVEPSWASHNCQHHL